jgi:DeoR/GlpR family transcriptional regulator of sugar metabolism
LDEAGKVNVLLLSKQFNVSNETIRRDMDALEEIGKLKRVYGGAVKYTHRDGEPSYHLRKILHYAEKQAIGKAAANLINNGDTVFLDTGTTILEMTRYFVDKQRITVVTNSLPAATSLIEAISLKQFTGRVIILGGEISTEQQSISGIASHEMLRQYNFDKAFLSVGGISPTQGITDYDMNESLISRLAAEQANEVIVLADHSKIASIAFHQIIPILKTDVIISDQEMPVTWQQELHLKETRWITVKSTD